MHISALYARYINVDKKVENYSFIIFVVFGKIKILVFPYYIEVLFLSVRYRTIVCTIVNQNSHRTFV